MELKDRKILILHDRFLFRGGGERLALDMARGLRADIATGMWDDVQSFPRSDAPHKLIVLGRLMNVPALRYLYLLVLFLFKTGFVNEYDVVIFSGNNSIAAVNRVAKHIPKIFYCHTPVRHAYDLRAYYMSRAPWWFRPVLALLIAASRAVYQVSFRQMDVVVTNSQNTRGRLTQYLNCDAQVIYPPIRIDKFRWRGQKQYYMNVGRVDRLKRVADMVLAFQKMPDKHLIVVSGGDELERVRELARGFPNIAIKGWVTDDELYELVGNCVATLYLPINEDAGMAQLEGMAAGKPCISVNEGGMKESVIDGKTGFMIPSNYTIDDIVSAVHRMTPEMALSMKDACVATAKQFSYEVFVGKMREVVADALNNSRRWNSDVG